ncbi:MAG: iron-siderophore ABC transporter substrate-binding protein [Cyanobacteria bacterium P01_B01_bin.77]
MAIQKLVSPVRAMRRLTLVITTAFAIAACRSPSNLPLNNAASTNCRTIAHITGETEICGQPQRIVVLGPFLLELLLALDIQPIGYGDYAEFHRGPYTDPSQQIPYLGVRMVSPTADPIANVGLAHSPSIEAIIKLQPDLILGGEFDGSTYEILSQIAPTLLLPDYSREHVEPTLRAIAQAVNRTEQAEQSLVQTQQQIAAARELFATLVDTHPQVALLSSSDLQDIGLAGPNTPCGWLIDSLGFQLVSPPGITNNKTVIHAPISLETLPQLNDADLVILLGYNFSDLRQFQGMDRFEEQQLSNLRQTWAKNEIAQSLDVSKTGRIYFMPIYLCRGLPGPIGTELYLNELKQQLLSPYKSFLLY